MNYDVTESPFLRVAGTLLLPDTILRLKNLPREHADTLVSTRFVAWSGEDELAEPGNENLNLYGLLCETQGLSEDEGETALTVKAIERVRITSLYKNGITCTWVPAPETQDLDEKAQEQMLKYIKDLVTELASSVQGGRHIARRACQYSTLNQLMAFLAQYVDISQQECYELIAMDSLHERSVHFIDYLLRQKESLSLNMEMREKLSKEASDYYRRQALIRQMEAIKSELDDGEEPSEKKNDYAARIKEAGMNEEVEKALLEDAKRLEETNPQSSDAEVLKNYLEFALSLPWKKEPAFDPDLAEARAILDARHAGMDKVKERIIQHLAIMKLRASNKGSAILLVGPPGTGKTSLGK